jgi:hypothetical protein
LSDPLSEALHALTEGVKAQSEALRANSELLSRMAAVVEALAAQQAAQAGTSPVQPPPLTAEESAVLDKLGSSRMTCEQLGELLDRSSDGGTFRQLLTSMAKRGLLTSSRKGYSRGPLAG